MLQTSLHICSTAHIPADERDAIDRLIVDAPRNAGGRLIVQHPGLVIEPYQFGFFVHTGLAEDDPERPNSVSPELWAILCAAAKAGSSWVLFDCDEPPAPGLRVF